MIKMVLPQSLFKIRAEFALTCAQFDGIDVIKEALLTAKHKVNDENWKVEFKMIAPPNYKVELVTHSRVEGNAKLRIALAIIKKVMEANKGTFKQNSEPMLIGASKNHLDAEMKNVFGLEEGSDEGEEDN